MKQVTLFVSGVTPEAEPQVIGAHLPAFLDYLSGVAYKVRNPESNVPTERCFTNDTPANLTMMVFAPDLLTVGLSAEHKIPMSVRVVKID